MIHFHPFLSSQSILQLARILSLILLAKFSCAVHVKGTGLAAEEPSATGYEPNDFTKETTLRSHRHEFSRELCLCCVVDNSCEVMQLLLFSPRSTMRRSWKCWHHTVQSAGRSKCGPTRNLSLGKRKILDDAHHHSDQTFGNPIECFSHRSTGNGH